jgi:hypothetical protein
MSVHRRSKFRVNFRQEGQKLLHVLKDVMPDGRRHFAELVQDVFAAMFRSCAFGFVGVNKLVVGQPEVIWPSYRRSLSE